MLETELINDDECLNADLISGDGSGTNDYEKLNNIPSINDVPLIKNKTLDELGIQPKGDYALKDDVPDVSNLASENYVDNKIKFLTDNDIATLYELEEEDRKNIEANAKKIIEVENKIPDTSKFITKDVNNLTNYYDKEQVDSKISSVYKYKGQVETYNDLLSKTDAEIGDVWEAKDTGENYAWDGTKWDDLGNNVDLSDYAKKEFVNEAIETLVDGDIANLTELLKENQDNIKTLDNKALATITYKENTGKTAVNLMSNDKTTLGTLNIINSLESTAKNAFLGADQGYEINKRLKEIKNDITIKKLDLDSDNYTYLTDLEDGIYVVTTKGRFSTKAGGTASLNVGIELIVGTSNNIKRATMQNSGSLYAFDDNTTSITSTKVLDSNSIDTVLNENASDSKVPSTLLFKKIIDGIEKNKQDTLIAGTGISIENNVISVSYGVAEREEY